MAICGSSSARRGARRQTFSGTDERPIWQDRGPTYPDYARVVHEQEQQLVPLGIPNPRASLYSETYTSKGPTLTTMINDRLSAIIAGRSAMSDYDALVTDWKTQGGDQIRKEYEQAYSKSAGA
jgi:putative aldouronate transport system substrate-binding protein